MSSSLRHALNFSLSGNMLFVIVFCSAADREDEMAFISHKVSVVTLLSLFVTSLLVFCATTNNKTNQPSYKMVSDILLRYVSNVHF